jgi:nucleoside diphosphate kinase
MEETVCIVKPDAVTGGLTERILTAAEQSGFYIVRQTEKRLTPARARDFYRHLEGTPQFRVTAEFMSSGPIVVAVLSKVDAINSWRELIGPTDPNVARDTTPGSLRAQLGAGPGRCCSSRHSTLEPT